MNAIGLIVGISHKIGPVVIFRNLKVTLKLEIHTSNFPKRLHIEVTSTTL